MTAPTSVYASGVSSDAMVEKRIDVPGAQLAMLLLSRVVVWPSRPGIEPVAKLAATVA